MRIDEQIALLGLENSERSMICIDFLSPLPSFGGLSILDLLLIGIIAAIIFWPYHGRQA